MIKKIVLYVCVIMLVCISLLAQRIPCTYDTNNPLTVNNEGMIKEKETVEEKMVSEDVKGTNENEIETVSHPENTKNTEETAQNEMEETGKTEGASSVIVVDSVAETPKRYIKPIDYDYSINKNCYTDNVVELIDIVLEKIKNCNSHNLSEEYIECEKNYTLYDYYKAASYFYIYYGQKLAADETFDLINRTTSDGKKTTTIRLRYDDIRRFEQELNTNNSKIDSILSTFEYGSEEYILKQISEYLKNNIVYTDDNYDLTSALNGKSVCNGYALAFNTMANKAGITSDICIGKVGGDYHAWNRVTLSNGEYRYYDITFYDSKNSDTRYLNSKTNFHGSFLINDYTDCWFKY